MVTLFYPSRWSYLIPTLLSANAETMCISRILPELKTWSWKSQPQVNYHPTNIADHTVEVHNTTLCHLSQPLQALVWGELFPLLVNVVINRTILSKLWIRNSNKVSNDGDTGHITYCQQLAGEIILASVRLIPLLCYWFMAVHLRFYSLPQLLQRLYSTTASCFLLLHDFPPCWLSIEKDTAIWYGVMRSYDWVWRSFRESRVLWRIIYRRGSILTVTQKRRRLI